MDKSTLRAQFRATRERLSAEAVAAASAALCRRLAAWLPTVLQPTRPPAWVLAYLAFRNELDLSPLFERLPAVRWAAPRIAGGGRLTAHPYAPNRLERHPLGMWEPAADLPVVAPQEIAVVLIPGVAFDRRGRRLGFGGGYYDRFLPTTPALRVGIAYDACLVDALPGNAHDQRMDWIATPSALIQVTP